MKSSSVCADVPNWIIRKYSRHSLCPEITSSTKKPGFEDRVNHKAKYCNFSVTPLEKLMLAPALVSPCIMNRNLKPKDAKIILQKHVVRDLPPPFVSQTLQIAKDVARSGASTSEECLSKLEGHAALLRNLGHHCEVETTDYEGMKQVRQQLTKLTLKRCYCLILIL